MDFSAFQIVAERRKTNTQKTHAQQQTNALKGEQFEIREMKN